MCNFISAVAKKTAWWLLMAWCLFGIRTSLTIMMMKAPSCISRICSHNAKKHKISALFMGCTLWLVCNDQEKYPLIYLHPGCGAQGNQPNGFDYGPHFPINGSPVMPAMLANVMFLDSTEYHLENYSFVKQIIPAFHPCVNPWTAGNAWVHIHHCGYWRLCDKAPGHQYPQCRWFGICYVIYWATFIQKDHLYNKQN